MKAFVDWILARRHRLILVAAATAPLLQVVTAALLALETLRRGVGPALLGAIVGIGVSIAFMMIGANLASESLEGGSNLGPFAVIAAASFAAGIGLGWLVLWARGLTLAFQGVVLFSVAAVIVLSFFGPGAETLLDPVFDQIVAMLREQGAEDVQIEAFRAAEPLVLGLLAAGVLTQLLVALFLAYWWRGLALGDSRFGEEFRDLRLSRAIGFPASVLVTVGLVLDAPLVQNLAPLALLGFLFQGLAVMHAWAHARRWHPAMIAPVYLMFVTPFVGVVVLALSAVGLMDNWFDLRAPVRPRA